MTELLLNLLQRNEGSIFEFVVNIIEHYNRFDDIMIERGGAEAPLLLYFGRNNYWRR